MFSQFKFQFEFPLKVEAYQSCLFISIIRNNECTSFDIIFLIFISVHHFTPKPLQLSTTHICLFPNVNCISVWDPSHSQLHNNPSQDHISSGVWGPNFCIYHRIGITSRPGCHFAYPSSSIASPSGVRSGCVNKYLCQFSHCPSTTDRGDDDDGVVILFLRLSIHSV